VAAIEELSPPQAMVLKSCALTRIAQTLVETYLGRDADRGVLGWRISVTFATSPGSPRPRRPTP
jgi:adenylate cyclase